jgi:flavin-dependent dehydrogenase
VTVWEAGHYPRHRVCGEFISGRGQAALERFGLREGFVRAGAILAHTAAFHSADQATPPKDLPEPALCLSRLVMDAYLADEFKKLGGELRVGERWRGGWSGPGVVRASGRRIESTAEGWRWFGLKAHVRGVKPAADLEMHFGPRGYTGICRLDADTANVCGLFRSREPVTDLPQHWPEWLRGEPGSWQHRRLAGGQFVEDSFTAVAGLSFRLDQPADDSCSIGDAFAMIPPLTGNGMSMAFESAEIALEPVTDYARGTMDWTSARGAVNQRLQQTFGRRLRWAGRLQRVLFTEAGTQILLQTAPRFDWWWRMLFRLTR